MISSLMHSNLSFTCSQVIPKWGLATNPKLVALKSGVSIQKPSNLLSGFEYGCLSGSKKVKIECRAYEADHSKPLDINIDLPAQVAPSEAAQKLKISVYFATWWALNVVFNVYNKKVLNAFPYPWLTSTLSLAAGSLIMLVSWGTRIAEAPKTDLEFWKTLCDTPIDWLTRMEIMQGITMDILHVYNNKNMIHGNLTSSNVVLDECTYAKVVDVGLSKLMTAAANSNEIAIA